MKHYVIFISGLNTYSTGNLRFGPLDFGPAYQHLEKDILSHGLIGFFNLKEIGKGPLEEQIIKAKKQIECIFEQIPKKSNVTLLGHSAGGLVARGVLHHLSNPVRIKQVITIGSPHRGSYLAKAACELKKQKPFAYKALRLLKYDTENKKIHFESLTENKLQEFNLKYKNLEGVSYFSVICAMPQSELPLALQLVNKAAESKEDLTDGLVEMSSQEWGTVIGHYSLDHASQLGFKTSLDPRKTRSCRDEYRKLISALISRVEVADTIDRSIPGY